MIKTEWRDKMAVKLSLDEITGLLTTEDGMKFADFMTGTFAPEGTEVLRKRIEFFWNSLGGMNIASDKFKLIMSSLLQIGVISQSSIDAFNAETAKQTLQENKYDMSYVDGNINEWINKNKIPSDTPYTLEGEIVTLIGELPSPARRTS